MKKTLYLFLALSISILSNSLAQNKTLSFNVIHSGKPLGTLDAKRVIDGDKTTYSSHTDIEYHMMMTINIIYDYNVVYENDALNNATVHITVRGHEKTNVKTEKDGSGYAYYSDGDKEKSINGTIKFSIEKLFFEEPIGITKVYAEEHGEYHTLKKIAEHTYLKTAPSGHKNTYYYKDGVLQKSDVDAGVIEFSIVRK